MLCKEKSEHIANRIDEALVFSKRFGSLTKTDYETLMFSIYLDLLDRPVRDYDISQELGIVESKVRTLRVRSQLLYPRELDWKKELANALNHGHYEESNHTITIVLEDPSVQNLLRNEIEKAYGVVNFSLNPKHLSLPVEGYLLLASRCEDNPDEALMKLNLAWRKEQKELGDITKEKLIKRVFTNASTADSVLSLFSTAITVLPKAALLITPIIRLLGGQ